MNRSTKSFLVGLFLQPLRIILILEVISLLLPVEISWESELSLFYWFGVLFAASFFVELIVLSRESDYNSAIKKKTRDTLKKLYPKYEQNLGIEFVMVSAFALLSFSSNHELVNEWKIKIILIAIAWFTFTEFLHAKLIPRLDRFVISEKAKILLFIPLSVFLVLFFNWVFTNAQKLSPQT